MRTIFVILILAFLFIGAWMIASSLELDMDEPSDVIIFAKQGFKWMGQITGNVWELTGKAIQQDWLPDLNEVNITKEYDEKK